MDKHKLNCQPVSPCGFFSRHHSVMSLHRDMWMQVSRPSILFYFLWTGLIEGKGQDNYACIAVRGQNNYVCIALCFREEKGAFYTVWDFSSRLAAICYFRSLWGKVHCIYMIQVESKVKSLKLFSSCALIFSLIESKV